MKDKQIEKANITLPVITPTGAHVEAHRRGDLSAVVAVSVRAGDEDETLDTITED